MKPQDPDFSQHSRLAQHLSLMELEKPALPGEVTAAEAAFVDRMEPQRLRLQSRAPARKLWILAPLVLAAAALFLMIRQPQTPDASWLMKGAGHVQVYVQQQGRIQTLEEAGSLDPEARVKAEVFSPTPTVAFLGVRNREGRLLQEPQEIWRSRLTLAAREKKSFPGSLQFEGPSEGETLCVLVCPQDLLQGADEAKAIGDLTAIMSGKAKTGAVLTACMNACYPLRL